MENNSLCVSLNFDGTSLKFKEVEFVILNPNQPLSEIVNSIINAFHLPKVNDKGTTICYLFWRNLNDGKRPEILAFYDEYGREKKLSDYDVQPGDDLHLVSVPFGSTFNSTHQPELVEELFIINLTIEGTAIEDVEVEVTDPKRTIREQIDSIIEVFNLSKTDNGGYPIDYFLAKIINDEDYPKILEFCNEQGQEQSLLDYNIQPGDNLHVISLPARGAHSNTSTLPPQPEVFEDIFYVYLTIEGTPYEEVYMEVTDPLKTIREQIYSIENNFQLPRMDNGGNPIAYYLGRIEDDDSLFIFESDDADGREQTLIDYNVQPGDHIHLISRAIAGGSPITFVPSPKEKRNLLGQLFEKITTKKRVVYGSVFAPTDVKPYSHMIVQVYLHLFNETEIVRSLAQESQLNAERRDFIPLQCKLRKGDKVNIQLNIYGKDLLLSEKKRLVWQGFITKCSFDYHIPYKIDTETLSCCVILSVNGLCVGEMRFITRISEYELKVNTEVHARQYKKIFISYAHQDESKVEPMARAYQAQGVDYFFDRHYLKPGDIFPMKIQDYIDTADLFILCWSANAAASDYVELERKRALTRAFPQVMPIEDAKLSIYPISIEPRTELPADMKDIYNFEVM